MALYEWKNEKGETIETESFDTPPNIEGNWTRVFSYGLSSINGAGGSPRRPPLSVKKP